MHVVLEILDSLGRSLSEYRQELDHRSGVNYSKLASIALRTASKGGEWRARSARCRLGTCEIGRAAL